MPVESQKQLIVHAGFDGSGAAQLGPWVHGLPWEQLPPQLVPLHAHEPFRQLQKVVQPGCGENWQLPFPLQAPPGVHVCVPQICCVIGRHELSHALQSAHWANDCQSIRPEESCEQWPWMH